MTSAARPARDRSGSRQDGASRPALGADSLLEALFRQSEVGVIVVDRELRLVRINKIFGTFRGKEPERMVGKTIAEALPEVAAQVIPATLQVLETGEPVVNRDVRATFEGQGERTFHTIRYPVFSDDGAVVGVMSMAVDITERRIVEQALLEQAELNKHQALHDALTGLGNRRKLYLDVEVRVAAESAFALASFDLDGFKAYNDTFGHPAGDVLLSRLGERLAAAVAGNGAAYRMGGDEFCIVSELQDADAIVEAADAALCEQGEGFAIGCSQGMARVPAEASTLEQALQLADERLYADKRKLNRAENLRAGDASLQILVEQHAAPRPLD